MTRGEHIYYNSRPLGKLEATFVSMVNNGCFDNVCFAVSLDQPLDAQRDKPLIYSVLKEMVLENPVLLCNIYEETETIAIIESLKYDDLVNFSNDNQSMEAFLRKMDTFRFGYGDVEKTLFKVFIVDHNNVYFYIDHSLFDGMSSLNLLDTFVKKLNEKADTNLDTIDDETFLFKKNQELNYLIPPPIEELMNFEGDWEFSKQVPKTWQSFRQAKETDVIYKVHRFTPEQSSAIKNICKANKASFVIYLNACFSVAQARALERDTSLWNDVSFGVDCRRYIKPEFANVNTKFGFNACGRDFEMPISSSINWDVIREETSTLAHLLSTGAIAHRFGKLVINPDPSLQLPPPRLGKSTALVNLGFHNFKQNENDKYKVKRSYVSAANFGLGFIFCVTAVSDLNGLNIITSMMLDAEYTEDQFNQLNEEFVKVLLNPSL